MSRLIRVTAAAAIAAAAFVPATASADPVPCDVTVGGRWVGGTTWTAYVIWPTVNCG